MATEYPHRDAGLPAESVVVPPWSPMLAGLLARLAVMGGLIAALWLVVVWSLQP